MKTSTLALSTLLLGIPILLPIQGHAVRTIRVPQVQPIEKAHLAYEILGETMVFDITKETVKTTATYPTAYLQRELPNTDNALIAIDASNMTTMLIVFQRELEGRFFPNHGKGIIFAVAKRTKSRQKFYVYPASVVMLDLPTFTKEFEQRLKK